MGSVKPHDDVPVMFPREDDGDVVMPIFESRQCWLWGKGNALTRVVML